jgi:hypothetical protein
LVVAGLRVYPCGFATCHPPCLDARVSLITLAAALSMMGAGYVEVKSSTSCPAAEAIALRLRPMLPGGWSIGPDGDDVLVEVVEARADDVTVLRLQLLRQDGSKEDRRLILRGGCAEMADAIATVVAAWEADFLPDSPVPAAPEIAVAPAPAAPEVAEAADAPADDGAATPEVALNAGPATVNPTVNALPSPARLGVSLGAALGAAMVGGVAMAVGIETAAGWEDSHWQLRLAATTENARSRSLDEGEVSFLHTTFTAGLALRSLGPRWRFSVDAGPVLGWVTIGGNGYAENRSASTFEYGVGAGLRGERVLGRLALWLDVRTSTWTRSQEATLTGSTSREKLPGLDIIVSLGGAMTYFR